METTYLFYDIESTGLNPCFDQVIQFAAIRLDQSLREIERYAYRVRLNSDVVPHPDAIATHGLSLEAMQVGETEYEVMKKIHALFNTPGTLSLGYNTLGFDDEFLRFSFYRNLLSPYTHQYAQGCGRMDIYPMAALYYLFAPEVVQWPCTEGKVSLKLADLNAENHFAQGQAHDAMVDVEATVGLARALFKSREIWDYALGYFNKKGDQQRLEQIDTLHQGRPQVLLLQGQYGHRQTFMRPALYLGMHQTYHNQSLWCALDSPDFSQPSIIRKKWGEAPFLLPYKTRFHTRLQAERSAQVADNLAWIDANPEQFKALALTHCTALYPEVTGVDADAALYQMPFDTPEQLRCFARFHAAEPAEKAALAAGMSCPIRREQMQRILGRHYYATLSADAQQAFDHYLDAIKTNPPIDHRGQAKYGG